YAQPLGFLYPLFFPNSISSFMFLQSSGSLKSKVIVVFNSLSSAVSSMSISFVSTSSICPQFGHLFEFPLASHVYKHSLQVLTMTIFSFVDLFFFTVKLHSCG